MVIVSRLDLIGIFLISGQLCRGVNQYRETMGADINLVPLVLQCNQGSFLFRVIAVQASFQIPRRFL